MSNFQTQISENYNFSDGFSLGVPLLDGEIFTENSVKIPFSTLNRHALIAGATGTGKTKTIQKFLESLSKAGIPSVMMDIKGDVSGISMPGVPSEKLQNYISKFGENFSWNPEGFPVEFFSLLGEGGSQIRSTVSEFGPQLFARVLGLTEVQFSALTVIFRYADEKGLLLVDLEDLKSLLSYLATDGKTEIEAYGQISSTTIQVLMRQVMMLESYGASNFFGEKSLEITDLMQNHDGKGQINIIRLMNSLRYPQMFSTMMIQLLVEIFGNLPEVGDAKKPKLVIIIDEAHLLFRDLPETMLSEIEVIIKLIRSKGVGIFFCTQNPTDIPPIILSQLGLKIQHALRAFTAQDNEAIKKMSKNFPVSEFYDIEKTLTTLGTGEVLVTAIGENGNPTMLVATKIFPPESRMDVITDAELQTFLSISPLYAKYKNALDPHSAKEILAEKIEKIAQEKQKIEQEKQEKLLEKERKQNPTVMDSFIESATKSIGTNLGRSLGKKIGGTAGGNIGADIVRGILGSLFK